MYMKKVIVLLVLMVMGYSIQAQGTQITIETATYSGADYNLIWDDDNNGNSLENRDSDCFILTT